MEITRRPEVEARLMDEMRASLSGQRPGIHLSDLLSPRRAYWAKVKPKPATDDEVGYWLSGRSYEDVYGRLQGLTRGSTQAAAGILFTVDFLVDPDTGVSEFAELKTRRRGLAADGDEAERYDHYIAQCRGYCALKQQSACWLLVWSLLEDQGDGSTKPEFAAYRMTFTADELDAERRELARRRITLQAALAASPAIVEPHRVMPLCPDWQCGRLSRQQTVNPRCDTCDREFQTEWGIKRHLDSRGGRGHAVQLPIYTYTYQPRCKWYAECRPWLDDPSRGASGPDPRVGAVRGSDPASGAPGAAGVAVPDVPDPEGALACR